MAKIDQGILGGYSGRIGSVVGYYRKGKWCVRAYQPTINDAKSAAQLQQRSIFKAMIQFASRTLAPIRWGMKQISDMEEITECNLFMRMNSQNFKHIDGTVQIVYSGLQFSMGDLPGVDFRSLQVEADGRVTVDYEPNRISSRAKMEDEVHVYAYLPSEGLGVLCAPASRRSKQTAFMLPDGWASQDVHFYGFTLASDGCASETTYLGSTLEPLSQPAENKSSIENKNPLIEYEERQTDPVSGPHRSGGDNPLTARGKP